MDCNEYPETRIIIK